MKKEKDLDNDFDEINQIYHNLAEVKAAATDDVNQELEYRFANRLENTVYVFMESLTGERRNTWVPFRPQELTN